MKSLKCLTLSVAVALVALSAAPASAQVSIDIRIGGGHRHPRPCPPPVIVVPAPRPCPPPPPVVCHPDINISVYETERFFVEAQYGWVRDHCGRQVWTVVIPAHWDSRLVERTYRAWWDARLNSYVYRSQDGCVKTWTAPAPRCDDRRDHWDRRDDRRGRDWDRNGRR